VQVLAVAVAAESAHKRESALAFHVPLHGLREVDERSPGLQRGDAATEALDAAPHERLAEPVALADRVGPRRVADPALMTHADVDRQQVARLEGRSVHVVRSVDDAAVDAQAGVRGEGRMTADLVAHEAARGVEIGKRPPDEGVDLGERLSDAQELDQPLVRLHDARGGLRGSLDVLGLGDQHGAAMVAARRGVAARLESARAGSGWPQNDAA
jgi:hypothetical protein